MKMTKMLVATLVAAFMVVPFGAFALSGSGVNKTKIKYDAKHGGEWFRAGVKKTDDDGVLKLKNVLPGWYKFALRAEDVSGTQTLAVHLRMLDNDGRKLKDKETFSLYMMLNDVKTAIGTVRSDDDGWVKVSGLSFDTEYMLDLPQDKDSHVSKKDATARIKVKTKVNGDWFDSAYSRTEEGTDYVLEMKSVLPGKYKFKYKKGDRDVALPFTLKAQLLDDHGKEIDEVHKAEVYMYINKVRTLVATVLTDEEGWVTLPGVMVGQKYKLKVEEL